MKVCDALPSGENNHPERVDDVLFFILKLALRIVACTMRKHFKVHQNENMWELAKIYLPAEVLRKTDLELLHMHTHWKGTLNSCTKSRIVYSSVKLYILMGMNN